MKAFIIIFKQHENILLQKENPRLLGRGFHQNGGPERDRTDDLLHAMQALSQLSYRPVYLF